MNAIFPSRSRQSADLIPGIRVKDNKVGWPDECLVSGEAYNGNNLYKDLRGKSWHDAARAHRLEQDLLSRVENCRTHAGRTHLVQRISRLERMLDGLDAGTAAAVYAVSAAGGIPVSSCNAGCLGGHHCEPFPIVSFWWPRLKLPILRECAKRARTSMWVHHRGEVVVGAKTIRRMSNFAGMILERRDCLENFSQPPRHRCG